MTPMNDTKWFVLAIAVSATVVIANVAFGVDRMMLVGGLFAMCLAAVASLRGSQTNFGWVLIVTQATSLVLAFTMSLYLLATDEGTRRKLSFSDVMMILGVIFALVSLVIGAVVEMVAYVANRFQRKHAALSIAMVFFIITVSITTELLEQLERNQSPVTLPPTIQMAPRPN